MDFIEVVDGGKIRYEGEHYSVYDLIREVGGRKKPHYCWQRICDKYPEVFTKTGKLQFAGRRQRETVVTNSREDALYILGLLPGAVGDSYRRAAAKLVLQFFDAPEDLIVDIIDYHKHNEERWARIKHRVLLTDVNKTVSAAAIRLGEKPSQVHNERYQGAFGKTTKQLRQDAGCKDRETPMNYMSTENLSHMTSIGIAYDRKNAPGKMQHIAASYAEWYEGTTGQTLEPDFVDNSLPPAKARKALQSGQQQLQFLVNH